MKYIDYYKNLSLKTTTIRQALERNLLKTTLNYDNDLRGKVSFIKPKRFFLSFSSFTPTIRKLIFSIIVLNFGGGKLYIHS